MEVAATYGYTKYHNSNTTTVYLTGKKMYNKSVLIMPKKFEDLYVSMKNKIQYGYFHDIYKPAGEERYIRHKHVKEKTHPITQT